MNKNKRGRNNIFLKDFNQSVILDIVRDHKEISKSQISLLTGLTPAAIGKIVSNLIDKGYLKEKRIGDSKGGRKPVLYELKPNSFYSLGIGVDVDYFHVILLDITGNIIYEKITNLPENLTFQEFIKKVEKTKDTLLKKFVISSDRLLGLGISLPGLIDNGLHKLVFSPNMGWENINFSSYTANFLPTKIFFENEANASAIAEKWFGLCKNIDNFICLNIKSGLGSGIFINGKLFTGNNGYSGEIGHTVFYENNIKCKCGNIGCLETFVTLPYIVEKAKNILRKQKVETELNKLGNIDKIDSNKIIEEAKKGDLFCKNLIIESAKYTGIAIAGLINSFNPSKVIIGEDFIKYSELAFDQVKINALKSSLKYLSSKVEIEVSQIGEKSSTFGAAVIPMRVLFNN